MKQIVIEVSNTVYELLAILTKGKFAFATTVEGVVEQLIDHAQQGIYRPGAWEWEWLMQAFGSDWEQYLEPGDPTGKSDNEDSDCSARNKARFRRAFSVGN